MSSKQTLTIEELRKTPEYAALTTKRKVFIDTYIETNGDILDAVNTAYDCKGKREESIVKWQLMREPKIVAVLERWTNRDELEIFLEKLKDLLRQKEVPQEKVRLMELQARMMGWDISGRQIQARAQEKSATLKQRREKNITRVLKLREEKAKPKEPDPEVEQVYDLSEFEAAANGDTGNGEAGK